MAAFKLCQWFDNIDDPRTRRSYQNSLEDFMKFTGIERPDEVLEVTCVDIIVWRDDLKYKIGAHARATAATNALDHQADTAKVQEWLGHA